MGERRENVTSHPSQREVFRDVAETPYHKWPAYDATPLYDRSSLGGLEEDIRTVARVWFEHDAHESVEDFVCRSSVVQRN